MASQQIETMGAVFILDEMPATAPLGQVKKALESSELDPEMAKALCPRDTFTRAKNALKDLGLISEVTETDKRWLFQLTDVSMTEKERLVFKFKNSFWLDKASQTVEADSTELKSKVEGLMQKYGMALNAADIMRMVHRAFGKNRGLVSLRHAGGVYFVPEPNRPLMDKIRKFMDALGATFISADVGVGNERVREQAIHMLVEDVSSELKGLTEKLKTAKGEGENGMTARKCRQQYKNLKTQVDRIKMFAKGLQVNAAKLLAQASTTDIKLAVVAGGELETLLELCSAGKITGSLSVLAETIRAENTEIEPVKAKVVSVTVDAPGEEVAAVKP